MAIIYISHRMAEIARVAQRLSVIRDGRRVLCNDVAAVPPAQVAESIFGREILHLAERPQRNPAEPGRSPVLSVAGLVAGEKVHDVSFDLARGEILGLAGLIGSGRTELAHCLFGVDALEPDAWTWTGGPTARPRHATPSRPG
jgi:ribose transport system ATP-binding protein